MTRCNVYRQACSLSEMLFVASIPFTDKACRWPRSRLSPCATVCVAGRASSRRFFRPPRNRFGGMATDRERRSRPPAGSMSAFGNDPTGPLVHEARAEGRRIRHGSHRAVVPGHQPRRPAGRVAASSHAGARRCRQPSANTSSAVAESPLSHGNSWLHSDRAMEQYRRDEMVFDVIDAGPANGPVVVLLHGFPQFNASWHKVISHLVVQGYRCLAPNQRATSRELDHLTAATIGSLSWRRTCWR